jgi:uncharacterized membrane protein
MSYLKPMPNKHHKILKYVCLISAILLILVISAAIWLYTGTLTQGKIKIFQTLPLPMALVNGHSLSMKDFLIRFAVAQKIFAQNNAQQAKTAIIKQLILENEVSQLAAQRGIFVSQKQIDQEYSVLSAQTNLQGQPNFEKFLQSRNLDESIFKNSVIKPKLLLDQLQTWFNFQPNFSPQAYALANRLFAQINSGGEIAALAGQYSEDPAGKSSKGDMGFVQITDLSPELRESVSSLKSGETKIIPGLTGLHIIRLEKQTGNQLHLKEIFLNINNFNAWLDNQTKNFKIINLLNI